MNLNKVHLIGRITKDPELRSTQGGTQICQFSIATSRTWKNKDGQKQEDTEFHNIVSFGKQAEVIAQYVKKGQLLYVEGRLQTRNWEDKESGKKLYRTEIMLEGFQFGPKAAGEGKSKADEDFDKMGEEKPQEEEINADDIPF